MFFTGGIMTASEHGIELIKQFEGLIQRREAEKILFVIWWINFSDNSTRPLIENKHHA